MITDLFKVNKKKGSTALPPPPAELPTFPEPKAQHFPDPHDIADEAVFEEPEPSTDDFTSRIVSKQRGEVEHHKATNPIFLRMHSFKSVVDEVNQVRSSLDESDKMLVRLERLHSDGDRTLRGWHDSMKNIHEKLIFVDELLFKGR
jgi:hypothetical protein